MNNYDLLVIGGDAAGMSAASQARRADSNISIGVFDKGEHVSYGACGMPYYISDEIKDYRELLAIDRDEFSKRKNISINTGFEAISVDYHKREVLFKSSGRNMSYSYGNLVIATGARPYIPQIKGINSKNIFFLRTLSDGISLKEYTGRTRPASCVIIGGGFIGLEMAESFSKSGIKVTVIEKMESVAMTMSPQVRDLISSELKMHGVDIHTGTDIVEIIETRSGLEIITNNGKFAADFVLVSVGVLPNTDFIKESGIGMLNNGAIIVDEMSRTNMESVFSAGDCASVKHLITGKDVFMPLGSTANKQGRVAGLQAAGKTGERFKGIVGSQLVKVFDLEVGKTGFNKRDAEANGIDSETASVSLKSRAGYYPGARDLLVNLTVNSSSHEIIGGEFAGYDGAALRTNIVAAAISGKMRIDELAYMDLGYAPPFTPVWDPVLGAAQKLLRK